MGTFSVRLQIADPAGANFESFDALVDTGSTYSVFPASVLQRLGINPHRHSRFELGDGSVIERDIGRTWVRYNGQTEMTLVVFGEEDVDPTLGAVTLEELQLGVDPVAQTLFPLPRLLM